METRSSSLIKLHAAQRHLVWKFLQPLYGHVRVAEFPKSGGTWLCQLISAATDFDFPRNQRIPFTSKCVQHSHLPGPTKHPTILVVRDIRDVLTSAYFHFLMDSKEKDPFLLSKWKEIMRGSDISDVKKTMPVFIKKFHENFEVSRNKTNWASHTKSYLDQPDKILVVKYEDMLVDTKSVLQHVLAWRDLDPKHGIDQVVATYSFKNQTKREQGEEDRSAFLRKGIAGDWKNNFNQEAIDIVDSYYGAMMRKLGYA